MHQEQPKTLKYWTLIEHLRQLVAREELRPGDRAPSLSEMQAQFGVSRATVEKAYTLLEQDGLLVREQGRGTFVARTSHTPTSTTTGVFGLLMHTRNTQHPYMLSLLNGMHDAAGRLDVELLWMNDRDTMRWDKIDGVLVYLSEMERQLYTFPPNMPRVSLLRHVDGMSSVTADDFQGAKIAVEHLLTQGHQRIGCLLSSRHDPFSRRRLSGYTAALRAAGIEANPRWVRYLPQDRETTYLTKGEQDMRAWLGEGWRDLNCTALLAANDETAVGVTKALKEAGLRVPEDISVVGFDGTEASDLSTPRLTTVQVPLYDIGARTIELLWEHLHDKTKQPREVVLPVQLKSGESTSPRG